MPEIFGLHLLAGWRASALRFYSFALPPRQKTYHRRGNEPAKAHGQRYEKQTAAAREQGARHDGAERRSPPPDPDDEAGSARPERRRVGLRENRIHPDNSGVYEESRDGRGDRKPGEIGTRQAEDADGDESGEHGASNEGPERKTLAGQSDRQRAREISDIGRDEDAPRLRCIEPKIDDNLGDPFLDIIKEENLREIGGSQQDRDARVIARKERRDGRPDYLRGRRRQRRRCGFASPILRSDLQGAA